MKRLEQWKKWIYISIKPYILSLFLIVALGILLSISGVSFAVISKNLIDTAISKDKYLLIENLCIFVFLMILNILLEAAISILSAKTSELISNDMQQKLFKKLLNIEWLDFSKYHSADILTRMTSDVGNISNALAYEVPEILAFIVRVIAAFCTLFFFEPTLAILAFFLSPVFLLFSRLWGRKYKNIHVKAQEAESDFRSFMQERLQNIIIVKSFCVEKETVERVKKLQTIRLGWALSRNKMSSMSSAILSLGYWIGFFLAFLWGIFGIYNGRSTFGTMTAFLQLVEQIQVPLVGLAYSYPRIVAAIASTGRLMEFDKLKYENRSFSEVMWNKVGIKFENVSFSYNNLVLNNVSFQIKPGEKVALIGTSGEGKTTLIRLILSLVSPQKGNIYFEDTMGEKLLVSVDSRKLISYVPQGNTLFSGTILENLQLAKADAEEGKLLEVLKMADALDFVNELVDGINTRIGENGLGLSEGQAQRIAIARAFLHEAPILILDEATSALDIDTEAKILRSLSSSSKELTCILITHRLSAAKICDRALKIEDGAVTEVI